MTKKEFLSALEEQLEEFDFDDKDIKSILEDYDDLITEAVRNGNDEADYIAKLGTPKEIAELSPRQEHEAEQQIKDWRDKVIALTPFISIITFFTLGVVWNLWGIAWLVFLIIPMTAIVLKTNGKDKIVALSPFIATLVFLWLGWQFNAWHPGWLVFMMIPMLAIILHAENKDKFKALWPFISLIAFILIGTFYQVWHPTWVVFLGIMILHGFSSKKVGVLLLTVLSLIGVVGFTVLEISSTNLWHYALLIPLLPLMIVSDFIRISWDGNRKDKVFALITITILAIVYYVIGWLLGAWHPGWVIFLLFGNAMVFYHQRQRKEKFQLVAHTPFIATILFFLLGEYAIGYALSWLVFLIIPIAGILWRSEEKE